MSVRKKSVLRHEGTIEMLHRASQFAAVVLIAAVFAAPAMACLVFDREMTPEEQSCCEKMAHQCESSVMPASHSCCQHPVSRDANNVSGISTDHSAITIAVVETAFAPLTPSSWHFVTTFESPPESPIKISSVLRI